MDPVTATLVAGGIAGGGQFLGSLFQGGMQYYGLKKQIEENQRVEALGLKLRREDVRRMERWKSREWSLTLKNFGLKEEELGLLKEKFAWHKGEAELNRAELQEQKNYSRIQSFAQNMTRQMNQNTNFKNNLINQMGARRAA